MRTPLGTPRCAGLLSWIGALSPATCSATVKGSTSMSGRRLDQRICLQMSSRGAPAESPAAGTAVNSSKAVSSRLGYSIAFHSSGSGTSNAGKSNGSGGSQHDRHARPHTHLPRASAEHKKRPAAFTLIRTPAVLPCIHARRGGFSVEALTSVVDAGRLPRQAGKRSVTAIFR